MNAVFRFVFVTLIAAALLSGCSQNNARTGSADIADAAARIADFTPPEGYNPEATVSLAGFTVVSYNPGDSHSHLYLIQAPEDYAADQAKLEETLRQAQLGQKDTRARMTVVEKRDVTIRGQQTTLVISEGTNSNGDPYREATATFQGKRGPALVVMSEPTSRWDAERVKQLVSGIK